MKKLLKGILILITMVFVMRVHAQDFQKADDSLLKIMKQTEAVGLAVAVVYDGKIIYERSFGYKELNPNVKLEGNELFRIASISKSFTATAIMQLVAKGKLDLDADVSKYVGFLVRNPRYPNKIITLKKLLSHTSSLNDSQGYFELDVINPNKSTDFFKCYNDYAPGEKYEYCNLGFNMLGTIVEKISNERFDNYIKKHILDVLGLNAGFNPDSLDRSNFASIYEYNDEKGEFSLQPAAYRSRGEEIKSSYKLGYSTPIFSPTGGMKISASDLARYMIMHMNYGKANGQRVIPEKLSKMMQAKAADMSEADYYGFALRSANNLIEGVPLIGHTGSAYGLYSAMFFNRDKNFGIVMITNGCNPQYKNGFTIIQGEIIKTLYEILIKPSE